MVEIRPPTPQSKAPRPVLLDLLDAVGKAAKDGAFAEYHRILAVRDPTPDDAAKLSDLLDVLDLDAGDVAHDLAELQIRRQLPKADPESGRRYAVEMAEMQRKAERRAALQEKHRQELATL